MGKQWTKTINLVTAIIDFVMAVVMMVVAISGKSLLALVFGVVFAGMGVYFLRYYERQRRIDNMTEEERLAFFKSGEINLVNSEGKKVNQQAQEKEAFIKKDE